MLTKNIILKYINFSCNKLQEISHEIGHFFLSLSTISFLQIVLPEQHAHEAQFNVAEIVIAG